MNTQELYTRFEKENDLSLHHQLKFYKPLLEHGELKVASIERDGQLIAIMPYFIKRKFIFNYITHPPLLKWMGPIFSKQVSDRKACFIALQDKLPKAAYFEQNLFYDIQKDDLPDGWIDYTLDAYSYRIENIDNLDVVYSNICNDYRNNKIAKANKILEFSTEGSFEEFYAVQKQSFDRQNLRMPVGKDLLKSHIENIEKNNLGTMMFARDSNAATHSVVLICWDHDTAYYHMAGDDISLRKSGSGIFLCWNAIKYCSENLHLKNFDFEGSMIPSIERVRKNFGAKKRAYLKIKMNNSKLFEILQNLKST